MLNLTKPNPEPNQSNVDSVFHERSHGARAFMGLHWQIYLDHPGRTPKDVKMSACDELAWAQYLDGQVDLLVHLWLLFKLNISKTTEWGLRKVTLMGTFMYCNETPRHLRLHCCEIRTDICDAGKRKEAGLIFTNESFQQLTQRLVQNLAFLEESIQILCLDKSSSNTLRKYSTVFKNLAFKV